MFRARISEQNVIARYSYIMFVVVVIQMRVICGRLMPVRVCGCRLMLVRMWRSLNACMCAVVALPFSTWAAIVYF